MHPRPSIGGKLLHRTAEIVGAAPQQTAPEMTETRNIFLDKLRRKLAERGYAGEALEAKLQELLARPLPPALAELMRRLKDGLRGDT